MNKICYTEPKKICRRYTGNEIYNKGETAFIGTIGGYQGLFLVAYSQIILAKDPTKTWSTDCSPEVERFVDVEIKVVEKKC